MVAGSAPVISVGTAVAVASAGDSLAILLVLLAAAIVGRWRRRVFVTGLGGFLLRSRPSRDLPRDAGEALELKVSPSPLATRLSRPVEGAQASVDGALVRLGTKLMPSSSAAGGRLAGAVVTNRCQCQNQ